MYKSTGRITLLAQSDPAEADLTGFLEQDHCPFPGYENVGCFSKGVRTVSPGCGNHLVMIFTPEPGTNFERTLHFITQGLKHPHEFPIHFMPATTTFAGHLIEREIGGYHLSHKDPRGENELST